MALPNLRGEKKKAWTGDRFVTGFFVSTKSEGACEATACALQRPSSAPRAAPQDHQNLILPPLPDLLFMRRVFYVHLFKHISYPHDKQGCSPYRKIRRFVSATSRGAAYAVPFKEFEARPASLTATAK